MLQDFVIQVLSVLCILSCSLGSTEDAVTDNSHSFSPYSFSSPSSFYSSSPSSFISSSPFSPYSFSSPSSSPSFSSTLKPMVDLATKCGDPGIIKKSC
jgi:hypothetical protein